MEENMLLVAARICSIGRHRDFDLLYLAADGRFARYTWTDRPDGQELWEDFDVDQLQSWLSENPSQIVMVCTELAPFVREKADAPRSPNRHAARLPAPAPVADSMAQRP